jgi:alpha-glucosidase
MDLVRSLLAVALDVMLVQTVVQGRFRRTGQATKRLPLTKTSPCFITCLLAFVHVLIRYGTHPFYFEHRFEETTGKARSHGVYLHSASGADILLLTPPYSNKTLIEYRLISGTFDFYFFSGPSPIKVIEQYSDLIGKPLWQPAWGFGFQLCRWGYKDINETREQVMKMRAANIPLEGWLVRLLYYCCLFMVQKVMWNDIDLYHAYRDFTTDPVTFPADEMKAFTAELVSTCSLL